MSKKINYFSASWNHPVTPKVSIGFEQTNKNEIIKNKLMVLKELLKECDEPKVKVWLRDKINELLIELL